MPSDHAADNPEERLPTDIPGLDDVLAGGFMRGATHVLTGGPGTGKTVMASQIAYRAAARGENVIYVSLLSESQTRLLASLRSLTFFDATLVGSRVFYVSGAAVLEQPNGAVELVRTLSREARVRSAKLLVIDSLGSVAELAGPGLAYRSFLRDLSANASLMGCTVILLAGASGGRAVEQYVADSVVELDQTLDGLRADRELLVVKSRGSPNLPGRHVFEIDERGVSVHPRREALPLMPPERPPRRGKLRFGISGLDAMLRGGVPDGSMTAVLGAPGSGKTLMGLHFLNEGLESGQAGVHAGLYETPERLVAKAEAVGFDLGKHLRSGALRMLWHQPTEQVLDAMAEDLLRELAATGARRLFMDGADGMLQSALHPERFTRFFAALSNELRARGISCLVTIESSLRGAQPASAPVGLSATVDNLILLRYLELRSQLHRLISILKVRESDYDASVHEFRISLAGFAVDASSEGAEALLAEVASQRHIVTATSPANSGSTPGSAPSGEL